MSVISVNWKLSFRLEMDASSAPCWSKQEKLNNALLLKQTKKICVVLCRSSRAVLQSDMVPQSSSGPDVYTFDRLGQRPLHSALGQEAAVHPGSLHRNPDWSGAVFEWLVDRWVKMHFYWKEPRFELMPFSYRCTHFRTLFLTLIL